MNIQTAVQKAQLFLKKKNTKSPVLKSKKKISNKFKKKKNIKKINIYLEITYKNSCFR